MSGDDNMKSCTLSPKELEALPDSPYARAPQADLDAIRALDRLPVPRSLAALSGAEIHRRYIVGGDPLPDLAAAEYIRRKLQILAAGWVRDERMLHAEDLSEVKAEAMRHRAANLRAASVCTIAGGNLAQRGLIKKVVAAVDELEWRAIKAGWPAASTPEKREARARKVAQLVKDMRRTFIPGRPMFTLPAEDTREIETIFSLDDFSA